MTELHLDFETRSTIDLTKVGIDNYSRHESTDVWCLAYAFGDKNVALWHPGQKFPEEVAAHIANGRAVIAHNVTFEFYIWNQVMVKRYGMPQMALEQCHCTMAMAYAMALPGALDNAAAAVGLKVEKDAKGKRLMLQMCRPRSVSEEGVASWWDDDDRKQRLYAYCKQDVVVERELDKRLLPLSPYERRVWLLDQQINMRGVPIDHETVNGALEIVEIEKLSADKRMNQITGGEVARVSNVNMLTDWLADYGVFTGGVAKADVIALLEQDLPDVCREALLLRQASAKTSNAKMDAMVEASSVDGRVRGTMQYHGAGPGRWAGRRIQTQNFPRPTLKQHVIEQALPYLRAGDRDSLEMLFGAPLEVISSCLRGMICAQPGNKFLAADWSNVEGRGLAWLAGEDWKVAAFEEFDQGIGEDIYILSANATERQVPALKGKVGRQGGKVQELALGYGGGVGAFQSMAKVYDFSVPDETAETIKLAWRERHPKSVQYWYDLEAAAMEATLSPGLITNAGAAFRVGRHVQFRVGGSFLWCQLPSGRVNCYPYPKIEERKTPWGAMKECLTYKTVNQKTRKWSRESTFGGKLAENVTQAICRDLLADSLLKLDELNYNPIMHVHDEIICEVPEDFGSVKELEGLMAKAPGWAADFPLAVEGWSGQRFRK